jgi:hypothetical protein
MSAFLHSDRHTVFVAKALVTAGLHGDPVQAAIALRDCNNKALAARYREQPVGLGPLGNLLSEKFEPTVRQVNTAARSFRYQCAEGDVPETHPMFAKLTALVEKTGGHELQAESKFWSLA